MSVAENHVLQKSPEEEKLNISPISFSGLGRVFLGLPRGRPWRLWLWVVSESLLRLDAIMRLFVTLPHRTIAVS